MNSDLKDKVFDIPEKVLLHLNKTLKKMSHVDDKGAKRIRTLIKDKSVTYQQIKRIIHDFKNMDKNSDAYQLNGGDTFNNWANKTLEDARNEIKGQKKSKKRAAELTPGMKNAHLKTHEKDNGVVKLNEQIKRIKKLFI